MNQLHHNNFFINSIQAKPILSHYLACLYNTEAQLQLMSPSVDLVIVEIMFLYINADKNEAQKINNKHGLYLNKTRKY